MKISAVYKITNAITGDFYIGSSKNVKKRWREHKWPSTWNKCPNSPMYLDMKKYGTDKFIFEILEEVEIDKLKKTEQQFIETLKPTYNDRNANGFDTERRKESQKKYNKSDKFKKYQKEYQKTDKFKKYQKEYQKTDKCKKYQKEYHKSDKFKKYQKEYTNQLCIYNDETLTLNALSKRFRRAGIPHPTAEAKKYLIKKETKTPIEFYDIYP